VVTSDEHADEDLTFLLDDSCAHCSQPIHLEVSGGELVRMEPDTAWVQRGGG